MPDATAAQDRSQTAEIQPYRVDTPEADLDDLRDRLARTRWPERAARHRLEQGSAAELPEGAGGVLAHRL